MRCLARGQELEPLPTADRPNDDPRAADVEKFAAIGEHRFVIVPCLDGFIRTRYERDAKYVARRPV